MEAAKEAAKQKALLAEFAALQRQNQNLSTELESMGLWTFSHNFCIC